MGLHAYCITAGTLPPPGLAGLGGAYLQAVSSAGIAAWFSEHPHPPAAGLDGLRAHDGVVRAAMTHTLTPIPLRYGQWFADRAELKRQLQARREHWSLLLDRFAGAVEMGVRLCRAGGPRVVVLAGGVAPAAADPLAARALESQLPAASGAVPDQPGSGRQYLERLRTEARAQDAAVIARDELLQSLTKLTGALVLEERCDPVPDREGNWRVAHLLRRVHVAAYQDAVEQLRRRHPDARVLLTGPWPPYSFATNGE